MQKKAKLKAGLTVSCKNRQGRTIRTKI